MWEERFGTEEDLEDHLREEHLEALEPACQHMLRKDAPDALRSAYSEAIAVKCRTQAPIAGSSLDRAALNSLAEAITGNKVEALICWCCGNIHPYVEEVKNKGPIQWHQPLERSESTGEWLFLRQPVKAIEQLLGLQVYLSRYNLVEPKQVKLTDHETFEDWRLKLPGLEDGNLLCCPEDRVSKVNMHILLPKNSPDTPFVATRSSLSFFGPVSVEITRVVCQKARVLSS